MKWTVKKGAGGGIVWTLLWACVYYTRTDLETWIVLRSETYKYLLSGESNLLQKQGVSNAILQFIRTLLTVTIVVLQTEEYFLVRKCIRYFFTSVLFLEVGWKQCILFLQCKCTQLIHLDSSTFIPIFKLRKSTNPPMQK